MIDAYFCPSAVFGKESTFLQNLSQNKTSSGDKEASYTKHSYFNQSNVNLHHQIFRGLAGTVVLVPQTPALMLGEASYSSQNMMRSPLTELL